MPYYFFTWTDRSTEKVEEHGIELDEFEAVVSNPESVGVSHSSGRPIAVGLTDDGREIACIFEWLDDETVLPITAYEV